MTKNRLSLIEKQRREAKHGDFFFATYVLSNGSLRKSPVFVVSNDNDNSDIIVCKCTKQPPRTDFDVKVQLKVESCVRANKLYTIARNQLLFKITHTFVEGEYENIITRLKTALKLDD